MRRLGTACFRGMIAVVLPLLASGSTPCHGASLADLLGGTDATRPIADAFSRAVARSVPLTSASAGISWVWDSKYETYDKSLFGQILLERPETIGRGNWSLITNYQWFHPVELDGRDLDELRDVSPPICGLKRCRPLTPYTIPAYHVDLVTNQVAMGMTYGVVDDLEVNLTVPVLTSDLHARIVLQNVEEPGPFLDRAPEGSAAGVGDLFLRAKYQFLDKGWANLAAGLVLRLPTGDEGDFQGTGAVQVSPVLYGSTDRLGSRLGLLLRPYVNAGADLDAEDVGQSEVRWGLGLDLRRGSRFTASLGFLARHVFEPFGPEGALDVVRCLGSRVQCVLGQARTVVAPLLGIDGGRRDLYDLTVGFRVALFRRRVMATANAIVPLNDEGIRPAVIPLVGIEVPFVKPPAAAAAPPEG